MKAAAFIRPRRRSRRGARPGRSGLKHVSLSDVVREVGEDLIGRPGRTLLTALGTLVGVAVLVGTLGMAASLESRIQQRFDDIAPREVNVSSRLAAGQTSAETAPLPWDGPQRALRITGVVAASTVSELVPTPTVRGSPVQEPGRADEEAMDVVAASPDVFSATGATIRGVSFDHRHDTTGQAVAVLGREAAARLGIGDTRGRPIVVIDGSPMVVIGIIEGVERRPTLLNSVVIPNGVARRSFGLAGPTELLVITRAGAAAAVAQQVPIALRPGDPQSVQAAVPPTAEATRDGIAGDTQGLLLALAGVSLVVGGIGIANVTLVAVLERTTEIGLRRAVGARRRDILTHFLLTSTLTGALGAVLGTCVGVWVTVVVAVFLGWPPTLDRWVLLAGPLVGTSIGLLAGVYPSWRASTIEPIDALRAGA